MSAAAAGAAPRALSALVRRTIASFKHDLGCNTRVAALDITPTHISLALSDRAQDTAVPFGVLARTTLPTADAQILCSALRGADAFDTKARLDVAGLVVAMPPVGGDHVADYVGQVLAPVGEQAEEMFPSLAAVLFYSEVHAIARSQKAHRDYFQSVRLLPPNLESRKVKRFAASINPKMPAEELRMEPEAMARSAASEILQAVLDDMKR